MINGVDPCPALAGISKRRGHGAFASRRHSGSCGFAPQPHLCRYRGKRYTQPPRWDRRMASRRIDFDGNEPLVRTAWVGTADFPGKRICVVTTEDYGVPAAKLSSTINDRTEGTSRLW